MQQRFWKELLELSARSKHRIVLFEAVDQKWKHELYKGSDVGTSWGWLTSDRRPKAVMGLLRGNLVQPPR